MEDNLNPQMATTTVPESNPVVNFDANHPEEHSVATKSEASNEAPVKITLILPTNAYFLSGVRDFTKQIVENITGFSEQWAFRFQSVVDELVNNAIEFGSAPGKDVKITFVSDKGKQIDIFVEDTGTGPNKKSAKEMMELVESRKSINPLEITTLRGRGLAQIVASWTDLLEYSDNEQGGLTAHIVKRLDQGEQQ